MPEPDVLRPFQKEVVDFTFKRKRAGLALDMGLGKSACALTVGARARLQRWLILCPDNAFSVWKTEAPRWVKNEWADANLVIKYIQGESWNRDLLWNEDLPLKPNDLLIYICTPDVFIRDWAETLKIPGKKRKQFVLKPKKGYRIPDILIFDEAKKMRNKDSKTFQTLSRFLLYYNVQWFLPMTGTPGHTPKDFWTMLHCIDRKLFKSHYQFINTFHEIHEGFFGAEILGPRNLDRWHQVLGQYFSVVKEDDEGIAEQRPPITRQLLPINMDPDQAKLYSELLKDLMSYVEQDDNLIVVPNTFALCTRLRQALVCPRILSPSLGVGAAIRDFAQTVEPEEHNVIFTPFTGAFPIFEAYLRQEGFKHVYALRGGMGTPARDEVLHTYRTCGGTVICSTLYAQAFSLEPATKSFAIGYDWNPDNNRQAEKRLHRLTTQNPITSYYYTFRSTFDERLCDIVNVKQRHVNLTIPKNLRALLSGEDL